MPWKSLKDVPDSTKHHDGATLTLAQANWVANIADSAEDAESPWAVAWSQFKETYKKSEDGKSWVKKTTDKETASRLAKEKGGSYKVMGNLKSGGTALQAFRLAKTNYTKEAAKKFCTKHGGYSFAEAKGANYYRCRVRKPEDFKKEGYWTQPLGKKKQTSSVQPVPELLLMVTRFTNLGGSEDPMRINVEVAMVGKLTIESGQEYKLTEQDFDDIIRNFYGNATGRDVFLDKLHMAEDPARAKSADDMVTLGRVVELWKGTSTNPLTLGKTTLCASLELNDEGKEIVEGRKFNYLSTAIYRYWIDRTTGEPAEGPVLSSIAFTPNPVVPFLARVGEEISDPRINELVAASRCMATRDGQTVQDIKIFSFVPEGDLTSDKGGKTMPTPKLKRRMSKQQLKRFLLTAVEGTTISTLEELLRSAISDVESLGENEGLWIKDTVLDPDDTSKGTVIYRIGDEKTWSRPYTVSDDGSSVSLGEAKEVVEDKEYIVIGTEAVVKTPKTEEKIIKIAATEGEPAEVIVKVDTASRRKVVHLSKANTDLKAELLSVRKQQTEGRILRVFSALSRPNARGGVIPPFILADIKANCLSFLNEDETGGQVLLSKSFKEFFANGEGVSTELKEAVEEVVPAEETTEEVTEVNKFEQFIIALLADLEKLLGVGLVRKGSEATTESEAPAAETASKNPVDIKAAELYSKMMEGGDKRLEDRMGKALTGSAKVEAAWKFAMQDARKLLGGE